MARNTFIIIILITTSILIPAFSCANELSALIILAKGQEYEKLGNFQEAIAAYEKALKVDPRSKHVYMSLGHIYQYGLNDKNKAIEYFKLGLAQAPNDYDISLNILYAYFDVGDFKNALKTYELLSKLDHKHIHTFTTDALNKIFIKMNGDEAVKFCKKYLAMNPGDNILREKLANIYMDKNDYPNARLEYEAILEHSDRLDNVGPIHFGLAVCDYYSGHYQSSLDHLIKAKASGEYVPDQYIEMVREDLKK